MMKKERVNRALKRLNANVLKACDKILLNLPVIINIIIPYIMFLFGKYNISYWCLIVPIILWIIAKFIKFLKMPDNEYAIPVYSRRFTELGEDGFVMINKNDLIEIASYLYDVEEYIESLGIAYWKK